MLLQTQIPPVEGKTMSAKAATKTNSTKDSAPAKPETLLERLEALAIDCEYTHKMQIEQTLYDWFLEKQSKNLAIRHKIKQRLEKIDKDLAEEKKRVLDTLKGFPNIYLDVATDTREKTVGSAMDKAGHQAEQDQEKNPPKRDIEKDLKNILGLLTGKEKVVGFAKIQKIYSSFYRGSKLPPEANLKKSELIKDSFKGKDGDKKGIKILDWLSHIEKKISAKEK